MSPYRSEDGAKKNSVVRKRVRGRKFRKERTIRAAARSIKPGRKRERGGKKRIDPLRSELFTIRGHVYGQQEVRCKTGGKKVLTRDRNERRVQRWKSKGEKCIIDRVSNLFEGRRSWGRSWWTKLKRNTCFEIVGRWKVKLYRSFQR